MQQQRHLGVASAAGICIASMIGSGIFAVPGIVGASLVSESNVIAAWVVGGVLALCGALIVAELAAANPRAGSIYTTIHDAMGPSMGWLFGVVSIVVAYFASLSVIALVAAAYARHFLPDIDERLIATVFIVIPAAVHAVRVIAGARMNDLLVGLKLLIMATFIVAGFTMDVEPRPVPETAPAAPLPWSAVFGAAVISINFAYLGWSSVNTVAGEVRTPERTLPRAIMAAIGVVAVVYLLMNLVFMRAVPPAAMANADGSPMTDIGYVVARMLLGDVGGDIVSLAVVALLVSTISTSLFAGSRLLMAMAWRGEVPAALGRCNAKGAPTMGMVCFAIVSVSLIWMAPVAALLEYAGLLTTVCASFMGVAVFIMRARNRERPFSMPLHPMPVLVYLALSAWLIGSSVLASPVIAASSAGTVVLIVLMRRVLTRPTS